MEQNKLTTREQDAIFQLNKVHNQTIHVLADSFQTTEKEVLQAIVEVQKRKVTLFRHVFTDMTLEELDDMMETAPRTRYGAFANFDYKIMFTGRATRRNDTVSQSFNRAEVSDYFGSTTIGGRINMNGFSHTISEGTFTVERTPKITFLRARGLL